MSYNRHESAKELLKEISVWCVDTGTKETAIGHALFLHPGFVGLLRKRMTLSEESEIAVRSFIYHDFPDGYHGELPKTHAHGTRPVKRASKPGRCKCGPDDTALPPRIERDPCPRCGVRRDIGCNHTRAPLGMVL
jgi:hypothetical protein